MHISNVNIWEAKAGCLKVLGQPRLPKETISKSKQKSPVVLACLPTPANPDLTASTHPSVSRVEVVYQYVLVAEACRRPIIGAGRKASDW